MESYSYKIHSSNSFSSSFVGHDHQHEEKKEKPYISTLHRVSSKSITKKSIAPSPPIPPKVYRVEAVNFRQVVQMLTAAPEFQFQSNSTSGSRDLLQVAPPLPPHDLSPTSLSSNNNIRGQWREFLLPSSSVVISNDKVSNESIIEVDERHVGPQIPTDGTIFGGCGTTPLGLPQSPSSFAWCSSLLLSPDTLTSLDSSAVL